MKCFPNLNVVSPIVDDQVIIFLHYQKSEGWLSLPQNIEDLVKIEKTTKNKTLTKKKKKKITRHQIIGDETLHLGSNICSGKSRSKTCKRDNC